jgi:hypothetical protein
MPALSFVLLAKAAPVTGPEVVAAWVKTFPTRTPPLVTVGDAKDVVTLSSGGVLTFITLIAGPVPDGEAQQSVAFSVSSFRKGGFTLPAHTAHLLVTTLGEGTGTAEGLSQHTRLVAAVTVASSAVGVYEGGAGATHHPGFYVDVASTTETPTMLWNGVSVDRQEGSIGFLSLGMGQLELPDVLMVATPEEGNALLAFMFDLLAYVATRGEPIGDGETVGRTSDEKLSVRYVPSPRDEGVEIARISMVD